MDEYERLQKARRKVAKWNRIAEREVAGAKYQHATIKIREWEQKEDRAFEDWQRAE